MGFEPTTYSMGSCHSTTELCPRRLGIVSGAVEWSQGGSGEDAHMPAEGEGSAG